MRRKQERRRMLVEQLETRRVLASLVNPGFENGLGGWQTIIPSGGSVDAVSQHEAVKEVGGGQIYTAKNGSNFAVIKPATPGNWTILSQGFTAKEGDRINGWAFFDAADYLPFNDEAEILVKSGGSAVATLFSSSVESVGDYGETPWTPWEYTFDADGTYTIEARIKNVLDDVLDSILGIDIAGGVDISVELGQVVPTGDKKLHLSHFLSNEPLKFPVTLKNSGGADIDTKVDVKLFISTKNDLSGQLGSAPLIELKDVPVSLKPGQTKEIDNLQGMIPSALATELKLNKGDDYYFVVKIVASDLGESGEALENNSKAYAASKKFAGLLSTKAAVEKFFPKYYASIRASLEGKDVFQSQGSPTPTDGPSFIAAFEGTKLGPYTDTEKVPTIGTGIALTKLKPNVKTALVKAVKDFYESQTENQVAGYSDLSKHTEQQVVDMLIKQAPPVGKGEGLQALASADEKAVYALAYKVYEDSARAKYKKYGSWEDLAEGAKWLLVDVEYNAGLTVFPSFMGHVAKSESLLAAYEFLNAKRVQQVGADRTTAGLNILLGSNNASLGEILN